MVDHPKFAMMKCLLVLLIFSPFTPVSHAQEKRRIEPGSEGQFEIPECESKGRLYVPKDYRPNKKWPLILVLHGFGMSATTDLCAIATNGQGHLIAGLPYTKRAYNPKSGIMPDKASCLEMAQLIDNARASIDAQYGVDQENVFLCGLFMGGWGVNFYGFIDAARDRYRGYILISAGVKNGKLADLSVTKEKHVLFINGDSCKNLQDAMTGAETLKAAGALVEQVVLPGEGSVPNGRSILPPMRRWLNKFEKLREREQERIAIFWDTPPLSANLPRSRKQEDIGKFLSSEAWFEEAKSDQPILIYCYSAKQDKRNRLTRSSKNSAKADKEVFTYPESCDISMLTRGFTCFRFDVSHKTKADSPLFNEKSAPFVILCDGNHKITAVLNKSKLHKKPLKEELTALLQEAELGRLTKRADRIRPILAKLKQIKKDRAKVEKELKKLDAEIFPSKEKMESKRNKLKVLAGVRESLIQTLRPN
ncbi:MAG: hypothetical protein ACI97A_000995 [Planctomycetota bacterium]|jgi:hypothetical protein